jgi:hypothetical protein
MTRKRHWQNSLPADKRWASPSTEFHLKQLWLFFLVVISLLLLGFAQPLWAVEKKSQAPTTTQKSDGRKAIDAVKEEMKEISDNVSESIARDKKTLKEKFDTPQNSQAPATQESDGPKAIDTVKERMNQVTDNISESIDRDKKTLKKKLDTLLDKE